MKAEMPVDSQRASVCTKWLRAILCFVIHPSILDPSILHEPLDEPFLNQSDGFIKTKFKLRDEAGERARGVAHGRLPIFIIKSTFFNRKSSFFHIKSTFFNRKS